MKKIAWLISIGISIVLIIILVQLWGGMNNFYVAPTQLVNAQSSDLYLEKNWQHRTKKAEPTIKIKTGIFIQALEFVTPTDVALAGYIWQHYQDGVHDDIKPGRGETGFIMPAQVNSGNDLPPREVYRVRDGNEEVIGWYFEATLRQHFDNWRYPFDHKSIFVRLSSSIFSRNIVLVPDYSAYKSTGLFDVFGIDEDIVLNDWQRENTYFQYLSNDMDTNFGIHDYVGQSGFPELTYTLVVKRQFMSSFFVHLAPIFLVFALLYGALLGINDEREHAGGHGFSASSVVGICISLLALFVVMHLQLREVIAGSGIVYLENFYILTYLLLVVVSIYALLYTRSWVRYIHQQNNLWLKTGYWPVVLLTIVALTSMYT